MRAKCSPYLHHAAEAELDNDDLSTTSEQGRSEQKDKPKEARQSQDLVNQSFGYVALPAIRDSSSHGQRKEGSGSERPDGFLPLEPSSPVGRGSLLGLPFGELCCLPAAAHMGP